MSLVLKKRAAEIRVYTMDFSLFPEISGGDTIASITSITPAVETGTGTAPTASNQAVDSTLKKVLVTLTGGDAGSTYSVTFVVVTTAGATLEAVGSLQVIA